MFPYNLTNNKIRLKQELWTSSLQKFNTMQTYLSSGLQTYEVFCPYKSSNNPVRFRFLLLSFLSVKK